MASPTLLRRALLLGLWLASIALLLDAREPRWWMQVEEPARPPGTERAPAAPPPGSTRASPDAGALVARGWRDLEQARDDDRAAASAARWRFRRALRARPDDVEARLGLAEAYRRLDQPARAWQAAAPLAERPLAIEQRRRLAQVAMRTGHLAPATDLLRAVVAERPDDLPASRDLAFAIEREGNRDDAARRYRALIDADAADQATVVRYVHLLDSAGRYREAWALLRSRSTSLADPELRDLAARNALWADDPAGAARVLDAWLQDQPGAVRPTLLLAEARLRQGEVREARRLLAVVATQRALSGAEREQLGVLQRWATRAAPAAASMTRPISTLAHDPGLALRAQAEEALEAGDPWRAAALAERELARDPGDADALVLAARAATARGDASAAARALGRLSGLRPLTRAEEDWWIGQLEAAGELSRRDRLLARRLAQAEQRSPSDPREIAELRLRLGDRTGALAAFREIPVDERDAMALRQIAALEAALQHRQPAIDAYRTALAASPGDLDLQLEAARFLVNAGHPALAVEGYRRVLAARPSPGLDLELARALLAAQRFSEAEAAARAAIDGGDAGAEARLALAQAVQLQGRTGEAAPLYDRAIETARAEHAGPSWWARLALSRDRPLRARRILTRAIDRPEPSDHEAYAAGEASAPLAPSRTADLLLLRGRADERLGDLQAAACDYDEAAALGEPIEGALGAARVKAATEPGVTVRSVNYADSNALRLNGAALSATLWTTPRVRWSLQAQASSVRQAGNQWTRTGASLGFDHLFLSPDWTLQGRLGFENASNGGGALLVGQLEVRKLFEDSSTIGLALTRESLLRGQEDGDPRLFNRIIDLRALGPNFAVDGLRGHVDRSLGDDRQDRLRAELGGEHYQDGNLRGFLYGHYQRPLESSPGAWTVVRPNLFAETFEHQASAYFSPQANASVGLALHTIRDLGPLRLEAEVNPQLEIRDGNTGFGVHGLVDVGTDVGPVNVGGSGFAFYDGISGYWLWRAWPASAWISIDRAPGPRPARASIGRPGPAGARVPTSRRVPTLPRARLVVGALLVAAALALGGCAPREEPAPASPQRFLAEAWREYVRVYVTPEGYVLDRTRGQGEAISEGQGYALLRAAWMRDEATFARVLGWTDAHLRRPDGLYSWQWSPADGGRVLDANTAADGDMEIAWALLLGARAFDRPAYRAQAAEVVRAVRTLEAIELPGGWFPAAGNWAVTERIVDLSYFLPYAFGDFAAVDPGGRWEEAIDTGYDLLARALERPGARLVPDFAVVTRDGQIAPLPPGSRHEAGFSFDAMRLFFRVALDCRLTRRPRACADPLHTATMAALLARDGAIFTRYALDGTPLDRRESTSFLGSLLPAFGLFEPPLASALLAGPLSERALRPILAARDRYYDLNWIWFGLAVEGGLALPGSAAAAAGPAPPGTTPPDRG